MKTYPLTQTQLGVYLSDINSAEDESYNVDITLELDDNIDIGRLKEALCKVVDNHPYIKSRIVRTDDGEILMEDRSDDPVTVTMLSTDDLEAFQTEMSRRYDLLHEPLYRFFILDVKGRHYLYYSFHHIISDGTSINVFNNELGQAYSGIELAPEGKDSFVVALEEAAARKNQDGSFTEAYLAEKSWYAQNFGDASTVDSMPETDATDGENGWKRMNVDIPVTIQEFKDLCEKTGASVSIPFTVAFGYTISRYSMSDEALFSTVYHGRRDKESAKSFGMFVKTVPVYQRFKREMTLKEAFEQTSAQFSEVRRRSLYSYGEIYSELNVRTRINFSYEGNYGNFEVTLDGRSQHCGFAWRQVPGFDIVFLVRLRGDQYFLQIEYRPGMFSDDFIAKFCRRYCNVLKQMLSCGKISDITLLDEKETPEVIRMSEGDKLEYDSSETFVSVFRKQAAAQPEATAVVSSNGRYTYRELDAISDAIACRLKKEGVVPGDFVCIMLPRQKEFFASVLGIQKAGAAYVPVDREYPDDRKAYMIDDSCAKVIIAEDSDVSEAICRTSGCRLLSVSEISGNGSPTDLSKPELPAYMIYTSGSTGKPKGVVVPQRCIVSCAAWLIPEFGLQPGKRNLNHPSFSFDASTFDIFYPLMAGAEVHIVSDEMRKDMDAIHEYIDANGITGMTTSTAMGMLLLNSYRLNVEYVMMGGEKLMPVKNNNVRVYNGYGPTEFTVCSSFHILCDTDTDVPIGRAVPNTWSFVCDTFGNPLPQGMRGELCLAGDQITDGYWNRPDINAERFCTCKMLPGQKMYRTGDLAKYGADGEIYFCGRIDFQVKLRGFRIELGEIESAAASFEGVGATKAVVTKIGGADMLCLYYTADREITADEMRNHVAKSLTDYMVPDTYMQLDAMPLTPNGKINEKALPLPEVSATEIIAPETDTEKMLFDLVAGLLGYDQFGVTTNLLSVGLTSLAAMKLSSMIKSGTGNEIPTRILMSEPEIRRIAGIIDGKSVVESVQKASVHELRDYYPLTENQRGVYIDWELNRNALQYNMPDIHTFDGITAEQLQDALVTVVNAHPILKARLKSVDGEVMVWRRDSAVIPVSISELQEKPAAGFFQRRVRPFNLFEEDLCRFEIYSVKDSDKLYLFADTHHTVFDGASRAVFYEDLRRVLDGETVAAETYTAYDRALDELEMKQGEGRVKAETYFAELLSGCETVEYPHSTAPDTAEPMMGHVHVKVCGEAVKNACSAHSLTVNSYLMTAFTQALHRIMRQETLLFCSISSGRMTSEMQNIAGMFVQTLPVVSKTAKGHFSDVAKALQKQYIDTQSYCGVYSYTDIVDHFGLNGRIMFAYEGGVVDDSEDSRLSASIKLDTVKMPVTFIVYQDGDDYDIDVEYDTSLYCARDMQRLASAVRNVTEYAASDDPDISAIPLLNAEESAKMMNISYGGNLDYDKSRTMVDMFLEQVEAHPDALAVVAVDGSYTYGELDKVTDSIAHRLIEEGVTPGSFVCVMLPRVKEFVAAVIGIEKAGAAYVPVDREYPEDRKDYMMTDSQARVAFVDESDHFTSDDQRKYITVASCIGEASPVNLSRPDLPAYMIYTSGSTGKPKGVVVPHRGVTACAAWYIPEYDLRFGKKNLHHPSFSFDASTFDLLYTLMTGAEVHILSEDMRKDMAAIDRYIKDNGITGMTISTAMGMLFLNTYAEDMEYIIMGGEKLLPIKNNRVKTYNAYGPTEFTVASSFHIVGKDETDIPIGRAVPNSWSFVCDQYGNLVPQGVMGELCLAGEQIAIGYWNRPDITAERFCECKLLPGKKMYRTGDLARYNEDGELEFCGRIDFQVKLRGFRIELGEIENAASRLDGVKATKASVIKVNESDILCLYFTSNREIADDEMRTHLAKSLTDYMVPDAYVHLDEMPLTPNGKINEKALPIPEIKSSSEYVEPRNDTERFFCDAVGQVLDLDRVGINDDFFKIGGTSIVAMRLAVLISSGGYKMVFKDLFDNPTPARMAAFATGQSENPAEIEESDDISGYDYSLIDGIVKSNTIASFSEDKSLRPLGSILLTGATGFLGIHILHELIADESVPEIYCLVRQSKAISAESRLKVLLFYYFDNRYDELFGTRIHVIDGDITDPSAFERVGHIDTLINCAASVKHFATGNELDGINVDGVRNCIDFCLKRNALFVQTSTCSVGGLTVSDKPCKPHVMKEDELYFGQDVASNKYCLTKFKAERMVLESISTRGLKAKIMRLGNLSSRSSDGEFQINFSSSSFMGTLKSYQVLGVIQYEALTGLTELSPIDETAKAILLLTRTNDKCVIFHPVNAHRSLFADVVECMNRVGCSVTPVESGEFDNILADALKNPTKVDFLQSLLSYANGSNDKFAVPNTYQSEYTTQVLFRLGFQWNFTSWDYMERFIRAIQGLGFFDDDYQR